MLTRVLSLNNKLVYYLFFSDEEVEEQVLNRTEDEDELEQAELERMERQLEQPESQEQKDYKDEFFELLDEVRHFDIFPQPVKLQIKVGNICYLF